MKRSLILLLILSLVVPVLFLGCEGDDGAQGPPGVSTGTISGTVTNNATTTGISGAKVKLYDGNVPSPTNTTPVVAEVSTDADGSYALSDVKAGIYTLSFEKDQFASMTATNVSVTAGGTATKNAALVPTAKVLVDASVTGTASPGATVTASVSATPLDGSTVTNIEWRQSNSVTVTIDNSASSTTGVTLPGLAAFKDELFKVLAEPPGGGTLPPGVPLPPVGEEEYSGGIQDRFGVVAINPLALEEAGAITLQVDVTTSSGTYSDTVTINVPLPWKVNTGIQNVPTNIPVLLHGGTQDGAQAAWNWTLTPPAGSSAALDNATVQNPSFTPDVAGAYTLEESGSGASFLVVAGTWAGLITGLGSDGRPVATNCFPLCHVSAFNAEPVGKAFDQWRLTGHAEIFTNNLNAGGHYGESCFVCHTVGYDKDESNGGIDDAANYQAFLDQFFPGGHAPTPNEDNFLNMLDTYPDVAKLTNIQCENCHGPNNSVLHFNNILMDEERVSLSSDLCGSCHGEPARHGRYQQWQLSGHANYELAIGEGTSGSCARCHSANGFIAWGEEFNYGKDNNVTVTWDETTVHPQTCAACHDPHDIGTITGEVASGGNAKVRIMGDTPVLVAGFQAVAVGRGALCMTCHNTRRGLMNDNYVGGTLVTGGIPLMTGRAPHAGAQADMLMGQNAFFVTVGAPGKHALITDTCVRCHMEKTPPPELLSYSLGGTNHTFFASPAICSECHDSVTADGVQGTVQVQMDHLKVSVEAAVQNQILAFVGNGDNVVLNPTSDNVTLSGGDTVAVSGFTDSHGQMAVTVTVNGTGYLVQIDNIKVNGTSFSAVGAKTQTIVKSGWNYTQALNDKSKGIHNPSFILGMLAAAQNRMDATVFTTI